MNKQKIPDIINLLNQWGLIIEQTVDNAINWKIDIINTVNRISYILECNSKAERINKERPIREKILFKNKTNWLEIAHEEAIKNDESLNTEETFEFDSEKWDVRLRIVKASIHSDNYYVDFAYNDWTTVNISFRERDTLELHFKNGENTTMNINQLLKINDTKLNLSKVVNMIKYKVFPKTDHIPLDAYLWA